LLAVFSGYAPPYTLVETFMVVAVGLLLFFTCSKTWALVLMAHSLFIIYLRVNDLFQGAYEERFQKIYLGGIALRAILLWELIDYIRCPVAETKSPAADLDETGNA
jgi:Mn2+/Fe2+ NRAMP family transporter